MKKLLILTLLLQLATLSLFAQSKKLGYERIKRPMFPLDKNMKRPNLDAKLIPASDELLGLPKILVNNPRGKLARL